MNKRIIKRLLPVIMVIILFVSTWALNIRANAASGVEAFVSRMYSVCLDRGSDKEGQKYWCEQLTSKKATGISVAYGFISSKEFQSKQCTNEQYVKYMYKAFFGREADSAGLKYWTSQLNSGVSRDEVFAGFANSKEFEELCAKDGIVRGYCVPGYSSTQVAQVNLFVERLYNVVLGRSCDANGMAYWTTELCAQRQSGSQVAGGFVFSPEFKEKELCDDHFLDVLYQAFMGRESDKAGKDYWKGVLNSGKSREYVFNGFASSNEFKEICKSYGIISGTYAYSGAGTYRNGTCSVCGVHSNPPENIDDGNSSSESGWVTISGFKFYIDPATGKYVYGFKKIGNYWYHFDEKYGSMDISWITIDGKRYYCGDDGKMAIGWKKIRDDWYYFDSKGAAMTGFQTINGKLYYFETYGYMVTKLRTIDGNIYYFDENGAAVSGWQKINGYWYYFNETNKRAKKGWADIKNSSNVTITYYFNEIGQMVTGEKDIVTYDASGKNIGKKWYRFKDSGALVKGWYLDSTGWYYYYDKTTGRAAETGWVQDGTKWCWCKNDLGKMAKDEIITTSKGSCYIGEDYYCKYGWCKDSRGVWHYADPSTGYLFKEGVKVINGEQYYFTNYKMMTNYYRDGYYYGSDGVGKKQ